MSEAEDVFQQLLSAKWRDIEFPVTKMRASIAHDLVEHKYWGVDGARVESTGLSPWRFTFSIPLINGLQPGRAERWSDLYPHHMRRLTVAFQKKSVGILQHPEFGEISCKAERFDMDWDAGRRGGIDGELSFVETKLQSDQSFLDFPTPVQVVDTGAASLDSTSKKTDLAALYASRGLPLPDYLQPSSFNFGEAVNKIKAVTDYPDLLERRAAGQLKAVVYNAERLQRSIAPVRSAKTWSVNKSAEQIKASAYDLERSLIAGRRDVALFTVPHDTTLAGVARQLPDASVADLIRLNPALMLRPEIARGTIVRYYVAQRPAA
jgi:hypothetical protein